MFAALSICDTVFLAAPSGMSRADGNSSEWHSVREPSRDFAPRLTTARLQELLRSLLDAL